MSIRYYISKLCKLASVSLSGYYKWISTEDLVIEQRKISLLNN